MADTDKALRAALYRLVFSIERHGPEAKRAHAGALKQAWDALGHSDEEFALIDGWAEQFKADRAAFKPGPTDAHTDGRDDAWAEQFKADRAAFKPGPTDAHTDGLACASRDADSNGIKE